ncbi:hypothetical protein LQ327_30210 [Actinomycetospora endophytica]|uniref:Uncharacterized protein n=1 Tax=Actinomycetospora endophytica TaxID=2291215 RepID=A0ABS8PHB5_9PSEU|nr:hypothetical protein [Actinomycetospora endophytica]MCD2197654.1 hypothetical protein [Actinomycetospora endophytica]
MATDRLMFPRPQTARVSVERTPVESQCPSCGSRDVARYPVSNHLGPRMVVKCQTCFTRLSVTRAEPEDMWPAWRSPTRDWPASRVG